MKTLARIELWTINRWLRWTGLRIYVTVSAEYVRKPDSEDAEIVKSEPTKIGLAWYGLHGSAGWKRIEGEV